MNYQYFRPQQDEYLFVGGNLISKLNDSSSHETYSPYQGLRKELKHKI